MKTTQTLPVQPALSKFDGIEDLTYEDAPIDVRAVRAYYRIRNAAPERAQQAWETRMQIRSLVGRNRLAEAQRILDEMLAQSV